MKLLANSFLLITALALYSSSSATLAQCPKNYPGARGTSLTVEAIDNSVTRMTVDAPRSGGYVQGADPFVFQETSGARHVFTTNRPQVNVPVYSATSENLWTYHGDALPQLPPWAQKGFTWAPEVMKLGENRYALWFTAKDRKSGRQCIGRALSDRPQGPYTDTAGLPAVCDEKRDNTIDPSPYRDTDGKTYLFWKTKEMVNGDSKTIIWLGELDADAQLQPGSIKALLQNDRKWEGEHIEAPTMIKRRGLYYLFYSAGASTPEGYQVSYATAAKIDGPYSKSDETILGGNKCMKGAGHQSIIPWQSNDYLIYYHSVYPERREGKDGPARFLDYAHLCFRDGKPAVQDRACSQ